MADKIPLKFENGETHEFAAVDTLANSRMPTKVTKGGDTDGVDLNLGTLDTKNVNILADGTAAVSITTEKRIGINKSDPQASLHIYGPGTNGSGGNIFFGDSLTNGPVPYVSLGENAGTDSDALAAFGKNGIFIRTGSSTGTSALYISPTGLIGLANESPTALLHLQPCAAGANSSSLKIPTGTLSTASDGAIDKDATNFYACIGTTRFKIARVLTGSAVLNFPNTLAQTSSDLTIAVTGAAVGDAVSFGVNPTAVTANTCYTAWVSAADVVTVRHNNYSALASNPASATFKVEVLKNA
jgi:hypothetical protein